MARPRSTWTIRGRSRNGLYIAESNTNPGKLRYFREPPPGPEASPAQVEESVRKEAAALQESARLRGRGKTQQQRMAALYGVAPGLAREGAEAAALLAELREGFKDPARLALFKQHLVGEGRYGGVSRDAVRAVGEKLGLKFKALATKQAMAAAILHVLGGGEADASHPEFGGALYRRAPKAPEAAKRTAPAPQAAAPAGPVPKKGIQVVPTASLAVDPERFQFKLGMGKGGAGDELRGTDTFNPLLGGVLAVWHDPADGKDYVVNGHHRYELAQRTKHPELAVRYIDAKDAREARAWGALINIAEGRGTPVDAAKFLRDSGCTPEELRRFGISLKGKLASDGSALSRLADGIFHAVATEQIPVEQGVVIGRELPNEADQNTLFDVVRREQDRGREVPVKVLTEMAREIREPPRKGGTGQPDLFGGIEDPGSLFVERNDAKARLRYLLAREASTFGGAARAKTKELLESKAGNILDTEKNKEIAEQGRQHLAAFDQLANRKGQVSDLINQAAERLAKGEKPEHIFRDIYPAVRDAIHREIERPSLGQNPARPPEGNVGGRPAGREGLAGAPPQPGPAPAERAPAVRPSGQGPPLFGETSPPAPAPAPAAPAPEPAAPAERAPAVRPSGQGPPLFGETSPPAPAPAPAAPAPEPPPIDQPPPAPAAYDSPARVEAAQARYDARERSASGGGVFGGEDLQAREGFARLPDGTPVLLTEGEHAGKTGRIVREPDPAGGGERVTVKVDGEDRSVPVYPTAVEPLDASLSWRTGAKSTARQGGLFAGQAPPKAAEGNADTEAVLGIQRQLNALAGKKGEVDGFPVESAGVGQWKATIGGKTVTGDLKYVAGRIFEARKGGGAPPHQAAVAEAAAKLTGGKPGPPPPAERAAGKSGPTGPPPPTERAAGKSGPTGPPPPAERAAGKSGPTGPPPPAERAAGKSGTAARKQAARAAPAAKARKAKAPRYGGPEAAKSDLEKLVPDAREREDFLSYLEDERAFPKNRAQLESLLADFRELAQRIAHAHAYRDVQKKAAPRPEKKKPESPPPRWPLLMPREEYDRITEEVERLPRGQEKKPRNCKTAPCGPGANPGNLFSDESLLNPSHNLPIGRLSTLPVGRRGDAMADSPKTGGSDKAPKGMFDDYEPDADDAGGAPDHDADDPAAGGELGSDAAPSPPETPDDQAGPGEDDSSLDTPTTENLAKHGVNIKPTADLRAFVKHLNVALHALEGVLKPINQPPEGDMADTTNPAPTTDAGKVPMTEEQPQAVAMSLKKANDEIEALRARLSHAEERASRAELATLTARIDALTAAETISPAEREDFLKRLSADEVRLSLGTANPHPEVGKVKLLLDWAEAHTPREKLAGTAKLSLQEVPNLQWNQTGQVSEERLKEVIAEFQAGRFSEPRR